MVLTLAACSKGPSTAAGPIGHVDLTSRLPAGVAVPADATAREATLSVCPGGKGDPPASIKVRWKTFATEKTSYVASYEVALEKQISGFTIVLDGDPKVTSLETPPPSTIVEITLKCTRVESRTLTFEEPAIVYLRADGVSSVRK